jgi:outer membrane receptor protein involved in Fe transport
MKKLLFTSLALILISQTWAQAPKANGKISGQVKDATNDAPVEFATIALVDPATQKPVNGTVCDESGKFTIAKIADGKYTLEISFIGFETQSFNVTVSEQNHTLDLGIVKLASKAEILNEVTVEAEKPLIEERVDRTIYNAENDQTAKGGDATDVLKRVPMLSVDMDGNVSMRGSSNVIVLINNKPSTIMASSVADAMKQIPADQIKSVEVITSPSAKYDAEGSAGIINIITKKNTLQGLTLNVDAGVGLRGSNLGLNGNYRKNKMGFSIGGFGRSMYNVNGSFENNQVTYSDFSDTQPTTNLQQADTRQQGLFGNYTLGWDYDINDKNYLTASARFGARNGNNWQDGLLTTLTDENGVTSSLRDVESKDRNNNMDLSLTYTHLYKKPQREFSVMTNYSRNNRNSDFLNLIFEQDGVSDLSGFKNINDSYNQEMTFQMDYQTPINDNQMIEFGGKDILRKVFSDYAYFSDEDGDGIYVPSTSANLSNNLNYDQNIVAGYLSYTYSTKNNYSVKAGARYEYTTINAYTQTDEDIDIPEYGALVPSVNISKKLNSGKTIKAAYNRRIQRPSMRYLNPNVQAANPYDISYGNPNLDPEYSNNFEFTYSTFVKGTSINLSTFWRNTNNAIQEVRRVTEITVDGTTSQGVSTTYQNIGQEDAVGMNVFANVNVGKLMLNGGADVYYAMLDNNLPVDENDPNDLNRQYSASNEGWVGSYRMFGSYSLSKGWGFQFFGFYRGNQVQLQGSQGGFGIYSLGLRKEFNDKKGSIGFGAENFFNVNGFKVRGKVESPLVNRESLTVLNNLSFRVTFSYRFGKMSMDAPKRRKSINNDDLKEGGDNNGGGMDMQQGGMGRQGNGGGNWQGGAAAGAAARPKAPVKAADTTVPAAEVEGTWKYTLDSPQGGNGSFTLKKEGDKYTGTITSNRSPQPITLKSVEVNGDQLVMTYEVSFGPNPVAVQVVGTVKENKEMKGEMSFGQYRTVPIAATKE